MQPDDGADLEALSDLRTPWCVHVAATLRVADHIAAGAADVRDIAAAAGCDADSLHRVLSHLVSRGVFLEPSPGRFALNGPARGLLEPGARLAFDLEGIGGRLAHAWGTLLTAVRTGAPAYHEVFGRPFWEDLEANPAVAASFDALMGPAGHGAPDTDIPLAGGWEAVRTVVDVGGGTGSLLAALLAARPHLRATLVDLPHAAARAAETFRAAGLSERAAVSAQSFFEPLPAGADIYMLSRVLNDWPDREAAAILARCAEAARPSGRVLVLGGVAPDDSPPELTIELVLIGGRQRSVTALGALARGAGLALASVGQRPSGGLVVELGSL